jgi:hypothetical protein
MSLPAHHRGRPNVGQRNQCYKGKPEDSSEYSKNLRTVFARVCTTIAVSVAISVGAGLMTSLNDDLPLKQVSAFRFGRSNSNRNNQNQINSNQINSNQIDSTQINSNQIDSTQINSNQINSNQINSNQINPNNQINSSRQNTNTQFNSNRRYPSPEVNQFLREMTNSRDVNSNINKFSFDNYKVLNQKLAGLQIADNKLSNQLPFTQVSANKHDDKPDDKPDDLDNIISLDDINEDPSLIANKLENKLESIVDNRMNVGIELWKRDVTNLESKLGLLEHKFLKVAPGFQVNTYYTI